jgi:hypothetical protein
LLDVRRDAGERVAEASWSRRRPASLRSLAAATIGARVTCVTRAPPEGAPHRTGLVPPGRTHKSLRLGAALPRRSNRTYLPIRFGIVMKISIREPA